MFNAYGCFIMLAFVAYGLKHCVKSSQGKQTLEKATLKVIHGSKGAADRLISVADNKRARRSRTDRRAKCGSKLQCIGNRTLFEAIFHFNCYCDHACFQIFSDCCPDYENYCGRQNTDKTFDRATASAWKCVEYGDYGLYRGLCRLSGATGVWMIHKCPKYWPFDEIRTQCETPQVHYPVVNSRSIPVVGVNNSLTYRNRYCAVCNEVKNYSTWNIRVFTYVTPPSSLDLDSKLQFILENGGRINHFSPRIDQPRRYCAGRNYVNNCTNIKKHLDYGECLNGPVEVVTSNLKYYKNQACGSCNGKPGLMHWGMAAVCGFVPKGFSLVFNIREPGAEPTTDVVAKFCPRGTVFDTSLELCRTGYIVSSDSKLNNEFLIVVWFEKSSIKANINSTLAGNLESALTANFLLLHNQISALTFHSQDTMNIYLAATFRLTLTPFQSLILANQHNPAYTNVTHENTAFLKLLNFTGNFKVSWKGYTFSVVKLTTKQLSCYERKEFQSHEYRIGKTSGTLVLNKTGDVFFLKDYSILKKNGGNITLCRKLVLSNCEDGAFVPLTFDEYVLFPNLSVYHNATNGVFNFGEYLISEILNKAHGDMSDAIRNGTSSKNSTISICLPYKNTFSETETKFKYNTRTTSYGVRILTLIGFIVSIFCLLALLITYGLFQELRTVPGMNLMNLSLSMLLSHLIWLVGTAHFERMIFCEIFAILGQYIFQVSFLAMSVISYHTCRVFSQPFVGRIANKSWRKFIQYSAVVWFTPAIFVAVCVALDKTETFVADYGRNCWLGTANARLYLFILPLALVLLYNVYAFIQTALSLSRHKKARRTLQQQRGKQKLLICIKLATLVGFPWLFAFLGVFLPDVEALEYLFVVSVCLQGLYIGMAFLFNKKILQRYKERWNVGRNIGTGSTRNKATSPTFQLS